MIRVTRTEDGGAIVDAALVRQPAIYLGQGSLAHIARTEDFLNQSPHGN